MNIIELNDRIIEYAKKVCKYPKGSKGYNPIDIVNLKDAIRRYEEESVKCPNSTDDDEDNTVIEGLDWRQCEHWITQKAGCVNCTKRYEKR